MPHKFKVGQMLELSSAPLHSNRPKGACKVLACLPYDNGPAIYRVKCVNENNERVVEEQDLSRSTATPSPSKNRDNMMSIAVTVSRK
jgi:hypothetical protein